MPSFGQAMLGLIQALALLAVAPLATGFCRIIRATLHSRQGPGLLQDYRDIAKLLRRQELAPPGSGAVFRAAPHVVLAALLLVAAALPVLTLFSPVAAAGDLVAVIYLLGLVRFVFALAGIDSGNTFAVIGASRELTLGMLVEPIMLLALLVAGLLAHSTNLGAIAAALAGGNLATAAAGWMAAAAFAFAMFVEMGKLPFDLAEAEQELQEGPLTEYSGPGLALLKLALGLKQVVMAAILVGVFVPYGAAASLGPLALSMAAIVAAAKLALVFMVAGLIEHSSARSRLFLASRATWAAFGVAALAFAFYVVRL